MFAEGDRVTIKFPSGHIMDATITIRDTETYALFGAYGVQASISLNEHPEIEVNLLGERS